MLFFIVKNIFVSLIFIISIHTIFIYFKENLTIPKTKDLVNKPAIEYEKIKKEIEKSKNYDKEKEKEFEKSKNNEEINMKDELRDYLSQLNNNKDSTPIQSTIQENNPFSDNSNFTPV
tara:strand:- start:3587 stop:3940 length:354 start_codon:yes stop_codon:yes gene_type:complete